MTFIKHSIYFKVLVVGAVLATVFEVGVRSEGQGKSVPAVLVSWFSQIVSTIPFTPSNSGSLVFALTNAFFFYGAFLCFIAIQFFIKDGYFVKSDWKTLVVVLLLIAFSIATIWHYVDMFLNQERKYYFERDRVFATTKSRWAFNAYDHFIAIAIMLQIAQASINTGLKRVFKRQVSA
jgi:hypothetical protein